VAHHPIIGPRYGCSAKRLATVWRAVLGREAIRTGVIEAVDGARRIICFVGVSICVDGGFIQEIKRPPLRWIGPQLLDRLDSGRSPMLSDVDVRRCNTRGGLSAIVWEGCVRSEFESREMYRELMVLFLEVHRGYLWNEVISTQLESVERLDWTLSTGGLWWDPIEARYRDDVLADPPAFIGQPHVVGITREIEARRRAPSWVGELFQHRSPRLGFSRGEQRLLFSALRGMTDEELSASLGLSIPTIKKRWLSIYTRASAHLEALTPAGDVGSSDRTPRGKEKKRGLLAYLRDHLEELRPVERRSS
jgi:DNA-binding CsgD family transcriptional regulator